MIGTKRDVDKASSSDTKKHPEESNKRAKKPKNSSIEAKLYKAINKGNETLVNELTCSVDFPIRTTDTSRDGQPILITLIEHGYTFAALKIIEKLCFFDDSDIINCAMYAAIKQGSDLLINALSTHEHFNPNAYPDQRFMPNSEKPLLWELVTHQMVETTLKIMAEKPILPDIRRMVLEVAITRDIPCIIKGMLQIFSIEKKEIFLQPYHLIKLFKENYISESCFNHAVLNKIFYFEKCNLLNHNLLNHVGIIKFLIKSKKMKLHADVCLTLSDCLERDLKNAVFPYKSVLFEKIDLKIIISEEGQDYLNKILPIFSPTFLRILFDKYLKETKTESSLPLYAHAYVAHVSDFYKRSRVFFHNHLFMEENILEIRERYMSVKKVIYNNDCFDISKENDPFFIKGRPLETENNIPIGYAVYLPTGGTCHSIVVNVYGGGGEFSLGMRAPTDIALLDKKIVQVYLNLYDVLQLKAYQLEMDENLHATIHESINHFFNVIKNSPESLSPDLSILKGKKIFLSGHSFGGRTAIRHAQLYPNTFDGYISFEGVIDCIKDAKNTSLKSIDRAKKHPWLDPALTIQSLSNPVLLMQNLDDSVVRSNCLFSFIRKAIEAKKAHLISFHITKESGVFEKYVYLADLFAKLPAKGHSDSLIKTHFQEQVNAVYSFVTKDKQDEQPNLIEYKNYHYKKLSHKYPVKIATLMKDAIAEGMEIFHSMSHKPNDIENLHIWESYYQPVFNAYYFACKGGELKEQFSNLLRNHFLTEEVLNNTMCDILPSLHAFLQEYHRKIIPMPEIKDKVLLFQALRETVDLLCKSLETNANEMVKTACLKLLIIIYRTNPSLLSAFLCEEDKFKSLKKDENEFKTSLIKVISTEKQLKKKAKEEAKELGRITVYHEEKANMKRNLKRLSIN